MPLCSLSKGAGVIITSSSLRLITPLRVSNTDLPFTTCKVSRGNEEQVSVLKDDEDDEDDEDDDEDDEEDEEDE